MRVCLEVCHVVLTRNMPPSLAYVTLVLPPNTSKFPKLELTRTTSGVDSFNNIIQITGQKMTPIAFCTIVLATATFQDRVANEKRL